MVSELHDESLDLLIWQILHLQLWYPNTFLPPPTVNITSSSSENAGPSLSQAFSSSLNHMVPFKLNQHNFLLWRSQIVPILKGHALYGFVTGETSSPPSTIQSINESGSCLTLINPAFIAWEQQDQRLLSWLLSTLSEPVLAQVVGSPSTTSCTALM